LLPIAADGTKLSEAPFAAQARQVFENLDEVLTTCGVDSTKLVQMRVYLRQIENWPAFDELYRSWIGDTRPARSVVPVPTLH
jgi:2-iminobutanoate/2-iminopropanoate deaminase